MPSPVLRGSHRSIPALLSLLLLTALPALAHGQGLTITGRVTSDQGNPLEIATVYITELNLAATTDAQGRYTLPVPAARVSGQSAVLRVRRIGHIASSRPITITAGTQTVDFALKQDLNRLEEVVVTGVIGEGVERSKVPFAVGRITAEDLPVPALDPLRALTGKVAGLRVGQTSGRPGSSPEIMLRGPNSINATGRGQGPLIIVDGAIMNIGSMEELGGLDIESVEVVKGAAGASLYGTRAANGVITIRTKRGDMGDEGVRFGFRSEYGFSDLNSIDYGMPINHQLQLDETGQRFCIAGSSNVASCSQTTRWMDEIMRINSVNADTNRTPRAIQFAAPSASSGQLQNTFQSQIWPERYYNVLAQMVKRNPVMLNQVDATGKFASVRFYVAGSYQNEQGALRGLEGNQQRRARVNLDYDAREDLLIQLSTFFDQGKNDNRGAFFGSVLRGAAIGTDFLARDTLGRPIIRTGGSSLRSATGNGGGAFLYGTENSVDRRTSNRFLGNITARYSPAEWVNFESVFAYDNRQRLDEDYVVKGYRTQSTSSGTNNGNIELENLDQQAMNGSLSANFNRRLRDDLLGRLTFRAQYDEDRVIENGAEGEVFLVKDVYTLTNTSENKDASSESQLIRNTGFLAATSFDYKDRYILDATFRYDGSSLFGQGNRWAPFGRISGVWRISEEPFWTNTILTDFRVRASRGTAGNTPRFTAQYETYNIAATGPSLGQAGNSKLRPETVTETEFGTDFTLFNRLGVDLTYAHGVAEDQILLVNTPASLGFSQQWQNAGTLDNKTVEVALNLPVITRENLQWSMRGTWDRTRSYITELFTPEYVTDGGTGQGSGSFFHITDSREKSNGQPQNRYGQIWGRRFYRSCGDMPQSVRSMCGEGKDYQVNDQGWVVFAGAGNSWRDGITKNLWQTVQPAAQSPWNVPLYFGHPIVDRPLAGEPGEGIGINQIIGNVFPDYRFAFSNNIQYKRLTVYGLLDASIGHDIYNQSEGWGLLDFSSAYFDQGNKTVETAKPMGYSWRAAGESTGTGGFYDVLGPNNYVVEDGSFAKVREVSVTYGFGAIPGIGGDWTAGVIGRNLFTFTNYSGLDPEIGATGGSGTNGSGSGLINQVDAFGFPTLRTFTFSLSTRF